MYNMYTYIYIFIFRCVSIYDYALYDPDGERVGDSLCLKVSPPLPHAIDVSEGTMFVGLFTTAYGPWIERAIRIHLGQ